MVQYKTFENGAFRTESKSPSRLRKRAVPTSPLTVYLLAVLVFANMVSSSVVLDAETGKECVDSDPIKCPFWAEKGECKANRGYMHVHCKKSCDRCNVIRVNDRNEISDQIAKRKKEIEERRQRRKEIEEKRKAKEALKALDAGGNNIPQRDQNANGRTAATATATISSTGEIETTIPVNTGDSSRKDGEKDASATKPNAAATATAKTSSSSSSTTTASETSSSVTKPKPKKKKTKIDAMTGLECVDLHENCPFWAATGDCLNNKRFMSNNCRLSCDRCHIVRVGSTEEMQRFMQQKQKEAESQLKEKKQAREINKILKGEL